MAEQCEMIIGFLVPHRCEHPALGRCARCGRGYCEEHIQVTQEGLAQPVALPITARTFTDDDLAAFDTASQWDVEDNDMFSDLS